MPFGLQNLTFGVVSGAFNAVQTTINVETGQGARFDDSVFPERALLWNSTDHAAPDEAFHAGEAEIVEITAKTGDALTIVRARENTAAIFSLSAKVYRISVAATQAALNSTVDVPYVKIEDRKTDGANGGTFISGARRTRDINTVVADSQNIIASLSGNQLELPAGTYFTHIRAAAYRVDSHILFLENVTDTTTLLQSGSAMSRENPAASQVFAEIFDRFTIAAGKKLEVQHECAQDRATDGFGVASTAITGVPEIYLQWELRKIA